MSQVPRRSVLMDLRTTPPSAGAVSFVCRLHRLSYLLLTVQEPGTASYVRFMSRHPQVTDKVKPSRPTAAVDVAARYLVYKIFDAISGTPQTWRPLRDIDEKAETLARAVERGWVVVHNHQREYGHAVRIVALTDEGRRMARRNLH